MASPSYPFQLPELPPTIDFKDVRFNRLMAKACTELGGLKEYFAGLPNSMLRLLLAMLRESIASSDIENVNTTVEHALRQQLFFRNRAAVDR